MLWFFEQFYYLFLVELWVCYLVLCLMDCLQQQAEHFMAQPQPTGIMYNKNLNFQHSLLHIERAEVRKETQDMLHKIM